MNYLNVDCMRIVCQFIGNYHPLAQVNKEIRCLIQSILPYRMVKQVEKPFSAFQRFGWMFQTVKELKFHANINNKGFAFNRHGVSNRKTIFAMYNDLLFVFTGTHICRIRPNLYKYTLHDVGIEKVGIYQYGMLPMDEDNVRIYRSYDTYERGPTWAFYIFNFNTLETIQECIIQPLQVDRMRIGAVMSSRYCFIVCYTDPFRQQKLFRVYDYAGNEMYVVDLMDYFRDPGIELILKDKCIRTSTGLVPVKFFPKFEFSPEVPIAYDLKILDHDKNVCVILHSEEEYTLPSRLSVYDYPPRKCICTLEARLIPSVLKPDDARVSISSAAGLLILYGGGHARLIDYKRQKTIGCIKCYGDVVFSPDGRSYLMTKNKKGLHEHEKDRVWCRLI